MLCDLWKVIAHASLRGTPTRCIDLEYPAAAGGYAAAIRCLLGSSVGLNAAIQHDGLRCVRPSWCAVEWCVGRDPPTVVVLLMKKYGFWQTAHMLCKGCSRTLARLAHSAA